MRHRSRRSSVAILPFVVALAVFAEPAAAQTAVTSCGQVVRGDAYLTGDLDCPDGTEEAVALERGTLDLRGFAIRGGEYGVRCVKETGETAPNGEELYEYMSCSVINGTLADQSILAASARSLQLTDVTIDYAGEYGVAIIAQKKLGFTNLSLHLGAGVVGIVVGGGTGRMAGSGLTIEGGDVGISFVRKLRIDGFIASGYQYEAITTVKNVDLTGAVLSGGTRGVNAAKVRIVDSTISGHSDAGVSADHLKISGSTITGNTLDLRSLNRPKLKATTCDTSNGWDVCAND